ncbi:copper chaperone PCu(A)C [Psychromonas antarctica]|uniref:copper chaperone PCu(A)C n=1 Tax=Psychromonas antarctica TaxID=67573 RepID=UPI001EE7946B|nr:copper chaperone PCu(A)C [Psychromonas antarctica]MCG6200258.1 copper chaperone PCu(A)C [Psychromonas antarctica]
MKSIILLLLASTLFISNSAFANLLAVDKGFARATPPHAKNGAAFMMIHNAAKNDINLIAASSDIAERVELHNHVMQDGLMKMRQVKQISIPAGGQQKLQPGGYHIMFLHLKQQLKDGESVAIQLHFDNGEILSVTLPIKK